MKQAERVALVRIFSDLIKADTVIDVGEMEMYARIKQEFSIERVVEREANEMTLSVALKILSASNEKLRTTLLEKFAEMTLSDGFCATKEALLMTALNYCLQTQTKDSAEVFSVCLQDINIDDNQAIYIEGNFDEKANAEIETSYRLITNELRLAGFSFVYIPFIARHYKKYDKSTFYDVANFLAPNLNEEEISDLIVQLTSMTTAKFCNDQLCNRFGVHSLRGTEPSLLIKISDNYVDNKIVANFLKIELRGGVLAKVQEYVESYTEMISANELIVPNIEDSEGQFLYHGFYKQLFDIYTIRNGVVSSLVVNLSKSSIYLPELELRLDGLRRKEKAFYIMLLVATPQGGINFESPQTSSQMQVFDKRNAATMQLYGKIYEALGGNKATAPDIINSEIRLPIISNIKKNIRALEGKLRNVEDYNVRKNELGTYSVPLSSTLVKLLVAGKEYSVEEWHEVLTR